MAKPDSDQPSLTRRAAFGAGVSGAIALAGLFYGDSRARARGLKLRPPGALPPGDFEDACVRCTKCAGACPNQCIHFHGLGAGAKNAFTPYIKARERGCTLCGECAKACPTNALKPFVISRDGWRAGVNMGTARVNKSQCYSFAGRTCGACYRACPLAGEAIKIGVFETPHVDPKACVGCGLCEQSCLHIPQAIRVIPRALKV